MPTHQLKPPTPLARPYWGDGNTKLYLGDCVQVMKGLPSRTYDAIITDPPYPCIKRPYGYWTEAQWLDMMHQVVPQCMRLLKPTGSAVFILQPNSERVGRMRMWLWEFMVWCCKEWNVVQDAYWWNHVAQPTAHTHRSVGLMRPSVKNCVWLGAPNCYRNQENVLWDEAQRTAAETRSDRLLRKYPSGHTMRMGRCLETAKNRGGVTPFNLLPIPGTQSRSGHGASTPMLLCDWWIKYVCPPNGSVLDPFVGAGTTLVAACNLSMTCCGIDRVQDYLDSAVTRLTNHA